MAAGSTYTPISTYTAPSTQSSVTFSSIPSTYTDLILVYTAATSSQVDLYFRLNGDTGSNYSYTVLFGTGSTAGSARTANQAYGSLDYYGVPVTTLGNSNTICHFMNYSNTTTNKTTLVRSNNAGNGVDAIAGLWRNTSAINSIQIGSFGSPTINTNSVFTLYGIAAA
jgi:hypothetical protein